ALQEQLKRVGCYEGPIDGDWGANAKQALANFSKFSGQILASDQPTEATLQLVTSKSGRVCIPTCWIPGEKLINGKCVANGKVQQPNKLPHNDRVSTAGASLGSAKLPKCWEWHHDMSKKGMSCLNEQGQTCTISQYTGRRGCK